MTEPRNVVVTSMKDEGPHILEWVAHYRALGFDDFVIAWNDCSDGTDLMLKRLEALGLVRQHKTRIWQRAGIQRSALKQARRYDEVQKAGWILVCDVDEFLVVKTGDGSLRHLIESARRAGDGAVPDIISVPWRKFGNAGVFAYRDLPVTEQFPLAEAADGSRMGRGAFVKSLFRGIGRFWRLGVHAPAPLPEHAAGLVRVAPGGKPFPEISHQMTREPDFSVAQINHYAVRSVEAFALKKMRGQANSTKAHDHGYWARFNYNDEPDPSIRRYDAARDRILAELRADPELARLHAASVEWHMDRLAALRAQPGYDAFVQALTGTRSRERTPA